jgi:adenine-specific DNA-methyltransferase
VNFPSTRYLGSKRRLLPWIEAVVRDLPFDTALDVFGGTGAVSYLFKWMGKQVTYNDALTFNWHIGRALIENSAVTLSDDDLELVFAPCDDCPDFIQTTFRGLFFTDDENAWLDRSVHNIHHRFTNPHKQALAWFALFQSCLAKRPYNLFHRANLNMRVRVVKRSFGNKASWDRPFEAHFRKFAAEANRAVFDNGCDNRALCLDAMETPTGYDLVYLDPPYVSANGQGVNYHNFYHFLEGMIDYANWGAKIERAYKHKPLKQAARSNWYSPERIGGALEWLIDRHRESIIVLSYRDDGIPSRDDLIALLARHKREVQVYAQPQQYALSKKASHELLIVGL